MAAKQRALLQVALDTVSIEDALRLLDEIYPHADIVEVGGPV